MSSLSANLDAMRTSLRQHIRSVPGSHRSSRLHRHLLLNEKERLEKEVVRLERRCCLCRQRVAEIEAQLEDARQPGTCATVTAGAAAHAAPLLAPTEPSEGARERVIRMIVEY